jgi:EpsI family protein
VKTWPFAAATVLLSLTLFFTRSNRGGENAPEKPLAGQVLVSADRWEGRDLPLTERDLGLLKLSDHVSRVYRDPAEGGAPVMLYVGYYQSQRTGATYHSPLNCLPGSGWQIGETSYVTLPGRPEVRVKKLILEKEQQRQVVLYWYHDRGRVITSEYAAKAWLVWDALRYNRTDGALVKITVPITTTAEAAEEEAVRFLIDLWPSLHERLPAPARS